MEREQRKMMMISTVSFLFFNAVDALRKKYFSLTHSTLSLSLTLARFLVQFSSSKLKTL
jgi:hypothetical protein